MRTADRRGEFVLPGAFFERGQQRIDVGDEQIGRAYELNVKARIQDVRGRHTLVDEPRLRSHDLGKVSEKSNDVVLDLAFDCVDARDIEFGRFAFFPDRFCGVFRD